jgi:circadian clock protein KaiB
MEQQPDRSPVEPDWLAAEPTPQPYLLRLFVSGMTPRSIEAISRIKEVCQEHLAGRYELEVVDIYQQPLLAKAEQIIATPTLIKERPLPLCRLVGDLRDTQRVLRGLDLCDRERWQV